MTESSSSSSSSSSSHDDVNSRQVKTVYLIRHAESEENRRISSLKQIGHSITRFSFPSRKDVASSVQLLNIPAQVNTPISKDGHSQVSNVSQQLHQANFWEGHDIQLVAYSPLQRARDTAAGFLLCRTDEDGNNSNNNKSSNNDDSLGGEFTSRILEQDRSQRVLELDLLLEKQPSEWIPGNSASMWRRIESFEKWLAEQPENKIVCVGHSQFFKAMLNLDFKFANCDVWHVQLNPNHINNKSNNNTVPASDCSKKRTTANAPNKSCEYPNLPPQWSGLKRLYQVESSNNGHD